MKCPNCGCVITSTYSACPYCGATIPQRTGKFYGENMRPVKEKDAMELLRETRDQLRRSNLYGLVQLLLLVCVLIMEIILLIAAIYY